MMLTAVCWTDCLIDWGKFGCYGSPADWRQLGASGGRVRVCVWCGECVEQLAGALSWQLGCVTWMLFCLPGAALASYCVSHIR